MGTVHESLVGGQAGDHLAEANLPCLCAPRKQNSDPHVLLLLTPDWASLKQVLGDMGVADNVAGRQGTARLGYCSRGVFSRHLSGLEPPPHYPALTSSFMPDHELARLSGDFSDSRSWKKNYPVFK